MGLTTIGNPPELRLPPANHQPPCPHFYQCGGCDFQNVIYVDQCKAKDLWLHELFEEIVDSETIWHPFVPTPGEFPFHFRSKIRFGFVEIEGKIHPSRHAKGDEKADIPITTCYLPSARVLEILFWVAEWAEQHGWQLHHSGNPNGWFKNLLFREGLATGELLVSVVTASRAFPSSQEWATTLTKRFPQITSLYQSVTSGRDNRLETEVHLAGKLAITERVGEYTFRISPHAFFQTNGLLVGKLYEAIRARAILRGEEIVWDLYAGSATIGTYLSSGARRVISIEDNPQNVADAGWNLEKNNIPNLEIIQGRVEDVLTSHFINEEEKPDVIIVDPPRAGLPRGLRALLPALGPHRLLYVSCNPQKCLRDCQELVARGYRLSSVQGFDMFPHTSHLEAIIELTR